jgi:putative phage-type endonuclease
MSFHIIDHDQGSTSWLRWRHDGIGGSDAPAVMGENPWRSARALFAEKSRPHRFGPEPPPPAEPVITGYVVRRPAAPPPPVDRWHRNPASRGSALEPYARELYNRHVEGDLIANCLQSRDRPWQRASLDGLCLRTWRALEIKCGDKVYAHVAATNTVPRYYVGQLQHILAVSGLPCIDFWVWLPGKAPLLITVPRDEDYIARLNAAEAAFWAQVEAARGV